MKNLKINKNLSKKIISYVLVGTMGIFTLTGCSTKETNNNLLKGTILENTNVVTFEDGTKDIVRKNNCEDKFSNFVFKRTSTHLKWVTKLESWLNES